MKVHGGFTPTPSFPGNEQSHGMVQGKLVQTENGMLTLRSREGDLPVRLLGADLPLDQWVSLRVIGQEGTSLILSAGEKTLPDGIVELLRSWGFEADGRWQEFAKTLFEENLPITKDNLQNIERWLRIAEHRWGVKLEPRVMAYLLAKELPLKAETLLLALHRLYPGVRKDFPSEVLERKVLTEDPENMPVIAAMLQDVDNHEESRVSSDGLTWAGLIQTQARLTPDGGEIHWRKEAAEDQHDSDTPSILLELFPPDLGWVRSNISWDAKGFCILFEVDTEYFSLFRQTGPKWQNELRARGYNVIVEVREMVKPSMDRLKPVDRWA